jgi:hypothetical protein
MSDGVTLCRHSFMMMVDYMSLLNYGCVDCDMIDYDDVLSVIISLLCR